MQDVQPLDAQALPALLDRPHHSVEGKVEDRVHRRHAVEVLAGLWGRVRAKQASDLRRKRELVARSAAQHLAQALLGQAVPVERRRVEEAKTELPRSLDGSQSICFVDRVVQAGQRRSAQAETREHKLRPAEPHPLAGIQISAMIARP